MKIKANDMCPKCKHCLGMTPQGMYSCGYNNDGSELNIGVDVVLDCANFEWFEWKDEKIEGRYPWGSDEDKVLKYCANDVTIIAEQIAREKQKELEDKVEKYEKLLIDILNETYSHPQLFEHNIHAYELIPGHIKFLRNSFNTMCDKYDPIFEENAKLKEEIERLKKSQEKLQNQVKNLQITNEESYKREEKLEDKCHKLDRRLYAEKKRSSMIDTELITPLSRVLYPREAKIYKPYSEVINDIKNLMVEAEENAELKEEIGKLEAENAKLKKEIKRIDAQRDKMMLCSMTDDKRWDDLNNKFWLPLCTKLYGTTKVNKTYETILSDISDLKDRADGNYKAAIRKDELIKHLRDEKKAKDDEIMRLKWRNDNQSKMIQDIKQERDRWQERCHNAETDVTTLNSKVEVLDKRNSNQSVMLGEKGKEIERLAKKNRELQIRVNDLLFQEKLNKSAFGYDYEEENDKLRVENERLRNENEYLRNRYPTYSAMKAEDKIEHIQKEAKRWKDKYKEAYDILQEFFGKHSNMRSVTYDLSGDYLTLKLLYDDSAYTKHNALEKARERMKKLD